MLKTTLAGSLPKPSWLSETEKLWPEWKLQGEELQRAKHDAVLVSLKEQEIAGLDIVGDGEMTRQHFVHGFLEGIEGIDFNKKTKIGIRADRYEADCPTVTSEIKRTRPVHLDDVKFTRSATDHKLKFTLPGPMTIVDTLADDFYGDRVAMAMEFAKVLNQEALDLQAAGVDVIQFDEPAFNVYLDQVPTWGLDCLHRAIEGLTCTTAVHICYGYGIEANNEWKKSLGDVWDQYAKTFPAIADSKIDQVSLECANSHVPISLIELLKGKDVLVGCIDVASHTVETPEQVAETIRKAMKYVDPNKLYPCTNCGMAPLSRDVAFGKLKALAAGAALVRKELGA